MAIRSNFLFHMLPEDELGLVLRPFPRPGSWCRGRLICQQVSLGVSLILFFCAACFVLFVRSSVSIMLLVLCCLY